MNAEVQRIIAEALDIADRHQPTVFWWRGVCRCGAEHPCDARRMADDTLSRHQENNLLELVRDLAVRELERPQKLPAAVEGWAVGTRHAGVGSSTPVGGSRPSVPARPPGA